MKPVSRHAQSGAVLVIALLFLTILTILGVTAMTATTFEEKMAGNTRDLSVAFHAAEAALRDARRDLNSVAIGTFGAKRTPVIPTNDEGPFGDATRVNGSCGTSTSNLGLCLPLTYVRGDFIQPSFNASISLTGSPSVEYGKYTGAPLLVGVSVQPRYFIEVLCFPNPEESRLTARPYCGYYRITARGYGGNPNTAVTLQEIFLKLS